MKLPPALRADTTFDCYGAGQRVTQELLNGTSWRTLDRAAAENLFAAYSSYLTLHRSMATLMLLEAIGAGESSNS